MISIKETTREIFFKFKLEIFRALYFLFFLSFFMPFIAVKGCSTKEMATYYGYELFTITNGEIYFLPIGIFLLFFLWTFFWKFFNRGLKLFLICWKTTLAGIAGFILCFVPGIQFLFG